MWESSKTEPNTAMIITRRPPRHELIVARRALSPSTPSPQAQPSALRCATVRVDCSARPKQVGYHAVIRDSAAASRHKQALDSRGASYKYPLSSASES
jgi:hypothetical protein